MKESMLFWGLIHLFRLVFWGGLLLLVMWIFG